MFKPAMGIVWDHVGMTHWYFPSTSSNLRLGYPIFLPVKVHINNYYWLVVWNIWIIFHKIYMYIWDNPSQLTFIFFKMVETTNQIKLHAIGTPWCFPAIAVIHLGVCSRHRDTVGLEEASINIPWKKSHNRIDGRCWTNDFTSRKWYGTSICPRISYVDG